MITWVTLKLIWVYQYAISPIMPARCRYYPTCSEYGKQAVKWHGGIRGGLLLVKRLLRCQPWGGLGVDFVPVPLYAYYYQPARCCHRYGYKDCYGYLARRHYLMAV